MENSTKQLLEIYYKGFAEKANWESVIADDFHYVGGDMTKNRATYWKTGLYRSHQTLFKSVYCNAC